MGQLKAKGFTHAVTENRFQVFTGQSSQSPLRVCMEDVWVELEPMNTRGVIGKIKLNKLTSQGLWLDADIAYSIREDGLKEEIILRDRGASNTYTFKLNLFGLKGKNLEDGSIGLYKETTGELAFTIPRPFMLDSNEEPVYSLDVSMNLREEQDGLYIDIQADKEWIFSPERVYPVIIDPSIVIPSSTIDSYVESSFPNSNFGTRTTILSGALRQHGTCNCILKWDLPTIPQDALITSAEMRLYVQPHVTGNAITHIANLVTEEWNESTVTWNNKPSYSGPFASKLVNSDGENTWDVTEIVQEWISGTHPNYGIYLSNNSIGQRDEYITITSRESNHLERKPKLIIEYVESLLVLTVAPVDGIWVNTSTPEIEWSFYSGSGLLQEGYQVQISSSPDFSNILQDSGLVYSQDTSFMTAPLPDGSYYWRVKVVNGTRESDWSLVASFGMDTTPPSIPLLEGEPPLTSEDHNIIKWTGVVDNVSGIKRYEAVASSSPEFDSDVRIKETTSTSCTFYNLLDEIIYYYRVRAIDNAGNISGWSNVVWSTQGPADPSPWWNSSWRYRQKVLVSNNNPWSKKNEPVQISISSEGLWKPGGHDIRVVSGSQVPYRIVSVSEKPGFFEADIVFEVNVGAEGTAGYYIYYGNPSATSASVIKPETNYTRMGGDMYYTWYKNPSRKWSVSSYGTWIYSEADDSGGSVTLSKPFKFYGVDYTDLFMNSNSYLDLGVTTYRSINPADKEGNLIRVDNEDHITSGYYLNDTEYMQFTWDGYEYDEWDELEYIFTNSLKLFKEDYKIYVNANSSYCGKTQIETTSELTGPRQSDTSGYAVVYIYKPVDFIIGSLQECLL